MISPGAILKKLFTSNGSIVDLFENYVSAQVGEFKIAQIARF